MLVLLRCVRGCGGRVPGLWPFLLEYLGSVVHSDSENSPRRVERQRTGSIKIPRNASASTVLFARDLL